MPQSVVPINAHVLTSVADYETILDETTPGTTYVGTAIVGSATSDAVWKIMRITVASGITTTAFANVQNNQASEREIWNNRASLTYA